MFIIYKFYNLLKRMNIFPNSFLFTGGKALYLVKSN